MSWSFLSQFLYRSADGRAPKGGLEVLGWAIHGD